MKLYKILVLLISFIGHSLIAQQVGEMKMELKLK